MGDSSDDDDEVPQLVAVATGKVPITIITGFLGKYFAARTCMCVTQSYFLNCTGYA